MFKTILCPVDPVEPGLEDKALAVAKQLVGAGDAKIVLLAVVPDMPAFAAEYIPMDFRQAQVKDAKETLAALSEKLGLGEGQVTARVRIGRPYHEILEEAAEAGADLIVMASHRPGLATYLIGSNATHVVRHARCSVMVLRSGA
ncbi:universal stress protein [Phreatobacter sp.]|uniref:universal stress protein n=1 Tax=Phreatobacter sp. TaxID=1966341 RepID=UPI003F6E4498